MSTDHSNSMPPFEMGSNSIEINSPLSTGGSPLVNAGLPSSAASNAPTGRSGDEATGIGRGVTTEIPGPKVDAIEFRVIRPGVPVRRLRLTGSRYTFGSAEGCSIRLNDATLRPMHAVLIRDANRVLVRAYSVPLEINGNRMAEASLQIGDVLRMGAYRLELLSGIDPAAKLTSAVTDDIVGTSGQRTGASQTADTHEMDTQSWHSRLQREAAQWRLRQSEVDLRENRCIERETELRARESEMWARADQLHRRESQLMSQETAAMQIQEEYLARKEELARLREESRVQRRLLDERQDQIHNMESEYQQQVENATRQLELSQKQAESATEAVQRMRDQFASLNVQLERLNQQQNALETSDQSHMEQHRQLQRELEAARDEAIDARAQSEAQRHKAEDRVAELMQQIEAIHGDESAQAQRASQSEAAANELRQQIDELENRVRQVTEEASQLREDYEGACASIRQLELLVDQTSAERDEARSGLEIESDALRHSVQQLTTDLGKANLELADLRAANDLLSTDLDQTRQQRDEAVEDAQSRPTNESFDALRGELDSVKSRLEQMQREYDETLARIDSNRTEAHQTDDAVALSDADQVDANNSDVMASMSLIGATDMAVDASESDESTNEVNASSEYESDEESHEDDREAWPTYQSPSTDFSASTDSETASENQPLDAENQLTDDTIQESPWQSTAVDSDESAATEEESLKEQVADSIVDSIVNDSNSFDADAQAVTDADVSDDQISDHETPSNHWRPDGQQSVEKAGHLSAWETDEAVDPEAKDDDTPLWQNESPEIAVDEAIADIEHSVDQAIADIDSHSFDATDSDSDDDPSTSNEHATLDDEADYEEETNPWAAQSIADDEKADSQSSYANVWKDSQNESVEDDSLGGYQPIDPWSQTSSDSEPESEAHADASDTNHDSELIADSDDSADDTSSGSLADMLIRDMEQNVEEESTDPTADAYSQPLSSYDDDEDEPIESTFVMDSATQADGEADEDVSPWNMHRPDDVSSYDSNESEESDKEPSQSESAQSDFSSSSDTQPVESTSETVDVAKAETTDDDDDSIEAYMNRLLKRVQTEPSSSSESLDETQSIALSGNTALMDSTKAIASATDAEPIDPNAPLVPRSQAPERSHNMSAMRDLANQSARSAVARSVKIQARDTQINAMKKFAGAATGITCALLCLYFREQLGLIWCGMCSGLGVIVAVMYGQEGMALWNEASARIKSTQQEETGESESVESSEQAVVDGQFVAAIDPDQVAIDKQAIEQMSAEVNGENDGMTTTPK
ncbi:MAG: FHA domain-containing protein [Pirellulaceae bacterium]